MDDRSMPANLESERAVLAAVLAEGRAAFARVSDALTTPDFYAPENRLIWDACCALDAEDAEIDATAVFGALMDARTLESAGGAAGIARLAGESVTSANLERHVQRVLDAASRRALICAAEAALSAAGDPARPLKDTLAGLDAVALGLTAGADVRGYRPLADAMPGVLADLERAAASADHGGVFGVPSGFPDLDRNTGGWHPGDLVILAARPGVGKTALALGFCNASGVPAGFVSLEMSAVSLAARLCAQVGRVGPARFRSGNATHREWSDWQRAMAECASREIWIDDEGGQTVSSVRARATRLQRQHRIQLLIVDYLQLLTAHGERREEQVAAISRGLKALAKRLSIPVICCAQLNRQAAPAPGAKKRPRPGLHHLRESGAIEQDADIVLLLDRDTDAAIGEGGQACELIVAKHRNGETGSIPLHWFPATTRFEPGTRAPEPRGYDDYEPSDRKDAGF